MSNYGFSELYETPLRPRSGMGQRRLDVQAVLTYLVYLHRSNQSQNLECRVMSCASLIRILSKKRDAIGHVVVAMGQDD